jgi:hypothetical protein
MPVMVLKPVERYDAGSRFGTGELDGPRVSVVPVSGFVGGGGVG